MRYWITVILLTVMFSIGAVETDGEWRGKRVAVLGDSMSDPKMKVTNKRFYDYLSESIGIEPLPYAKSGYTWKDLSDMAVKLAEEHPDDIDAIFIWGGTNDYNKGVPIGSFFIEDTAQTIYNGEEVLRKQRKLTEDPETFAGRINEVLSFLKSTYPEKQIVILTPIHRGYARFGNKNVQPDETYSNSEGLYIDDYVVALKDAGRIWSVPVIDLFGESGILPVLPSNYIYIANPETDNLHPNDSGHKRIARLVERQLSKIPSGFE